MKFLIVVLAVISVCAAQSDSDWERFQSKYGKSYRSADEAVNRRAIWEKNWKKINSHNERFAKGEFSYTLGENQFADMTYEEFSKQLLGLNPSAAPSYKEVHEISGKAVAKSFDLRSNGWVTPVRDQGRCGGCWAFATAATVETLFLRVKGVQNPNFSPQHLIDCSKGLLLGIIRRNNGCNGGQLMATYDDMVKIGVQDEINWPYKAADGTCPTSYTIVNKIGGGVSVTTEAAIIDAVEKGNAVSVGIFASENLQLYKSGIYHGNATENSANPNHAVVVVAYDINTNGAEHYTIKNSWHQSWGENGYFRLRHGGNHLKIASMAAYPKF